MNVTCVNNYETGITITIMPYTNLKNVSIQSAAL